MFTLATWSTIKIFLASLTFVNICVRASLLIFVSSLYSILISLCVVFLGTEKYPDETEYSKFLSQHGGSSNAYTAGDHTNYYFDVTPKNLEGALERFSQFFIAPLFTESATDREVNAVNSEHEKNLPSDTWRLRQLESSLSDPEHDYHKFGTGSKVGQVSCVALAKCRL